MKVLHLPSNVAGNAFGLAQGERQLGLDSQALTFGSSKYYFPSDIIIPTRKSLLSHLFHRFNTFLKVRNQYDVYHYNFGSSLLHYMKFGLNLADLPFYKQDAVKVVTYQGCDARQKYPTMKRVSEKSPPTQAACLYEGCYDGMCNSGKKDLQRRKAIDKMMTHCQHAFAVNPDLLHFLPQEKASFLPYTIPNFDLIPTKESLYFNQDKIHIIHAPTQRITKGTDFIIKAIDKIKTDFPNRIDFELIENLPYKQAMERYQQADLVIDQVLIGWYGGLAVEVMKMGIPVMAFINEDDLRFVPNGFKEALPIINVSIDTMYDKLKDIVQHREQLPIIGKTAQQFVDQWHHPEYVASLTKEVYEQCAV